MRTLSSSLIAALCAAFLSCLTPIAPSGACVLARPAGSVLRVVGPSGEPTPVVNERGKARLSVVDGQGQQVAVQSWASDSPEVAKVSRKGVVKGRQYGFASITARTASGEVSGFVVVVRVTDRPGAQAQGDTKEDRAGNVYLSSPKQNVIYRTAGGRDEVFAGQAGRPGYEDGPGDRARFDTPTGLGIDNRAEGGIYVADTANHCIRRVDFEGRATTALGRARAAGMMALDVTRIEQAAMTGPRGVASVGRNFFFTDTGNHAIYYADFGRGEVVLVAGQPGETGRANGRGREARFDGPSGLAINTRGDLLAVADTGNNVVRLVAITRTAEGRVVGEVTTLGQASSTRRAVFGEASRKDRGEDAIEFDGPVSVGLDGVENVYVIDARGASVVTREVGRLPEKQELAQAGSLGRPASVTVSGTRALVLDEGAKRAKRAVKTVEVGAPEITGLSGNIDWIDGGREVIVEGRNFARESRVTLGDAEVVDYEVLTSRKIRFVVPPQRGTGARTLSVLTRGGVAQALFHIRPKYLAEIETGESTTLAGGGTLYRGDGRRADALNVSVHPKDVVVDGAGNLFIADGTSNSVRRIDAMTRVVTTVAGNGTREYTGDGGLATNAGLDDPRSVVVDGGGNLYVADTANARIRRVDAVTGIITTIAGTGVFGNDGDGGSATAATLSTVNKLAIDAESNLFVATMPDGVTPNAIAIRRIDAKTGIITTVLTGVEADGLVVDAQGDLYIASRNDNVVRRLTTAGSLELVAGTGEFGFGGDGGPATAAAFRGPVCVAVDGAGNVFVGDLNNDRVRRVDASTGIITTVAGNGTDVYAGDGSLATETGGLAASEVMIDSSGNLFIASQFALVLRVVESATNRITTVAGTGMESVELENVPATSALTYSVGLAVDGDGNIFVGEPETARIRRVDVETHVMSDFAGNGLPEYGGDGGPALAAGIPSPVDLALDDAGNLYVADDLSNRVRKIDAATGVITTVAGTGVAEFSGDGGPATAAGLNGPRAVAFDASGSLLIADAGNARVRRVDAQSGVITTIAGNGDPAHGGDGGPATVAGVKPESLGIDGAGNLYIGDEANNRVRKVGPDGIITTAVVGGTTGPVGVDDLRVYGVAPDALGNLFLSDLVYNRVWRVDASTGGFTLVAGGDLESTRNIALNRIVLDTEGNLLISSFAVESRARPGRRGSVVAIRAVGVPLSGR